MSKHTPGPWFAKPKDSSGWVDIVRIMPYGNESLPFAACKHLDQVANARLIAAALDLLDALRHIEGVAMADEPRDLPGIVQTARSAIAKATGDKT